tara:strand:+ start:838 stop:1359 length:522 start_codon:yes stop_codon:yes gene_type:complete
MTGIVGSTFSNSKLLGAADRLVIDGITSIATGSGAEQVYRYYPGNLTGSFDHLVTAFTPRQQCVLHASWIGHHNFSSGARYFVIGMRQGSSEDLTDDHFQTMQTGSDASNTDVWGGSFHTYQTGGWYGFSQQTVFSLQRDVAYRVRLFVSGGSSSVNGSELIMRFDIPASHQH